MKVSNHEKSMAEFLKLTSPQRLHRLRASISTLGAQCQDKLDERTATMQDLCLYMFGNSGVILPDLFVLKQFLNEHMCILMTQQSSHLFALSVTGAFHFNTLANSARLLSIEALRLSMLMNHVNQAIMNNTKLTRFDKNEQNIFLHG